MGTNWELFGNKLGTVPFNVVAPRQASTRYQLNACLEQEVPAALRGELTQPSNFNDDVSPRPSPANHANLEIGGDAGSAPWFVCGRRNVYDVLPQGVKYKQLHTAASVKASAWLATQVVVCTLCSWSSTCRQPSSV